MRQKRGLRMWDGELEEEEGEEEEGEYKDLTAAD